MTSYAYDVPSLSEKVKTGDRIDGKYRVLGVLGNGASATVYEAVHEEIDAPVAVKVVHAEATNEPHHLARFRREARTCGRVRSRHVPQVYDVGRLPDGSPYMVMELLRGETLEAWVTRGPLPLGLVFEIGKQVLTALEAVHAQRAIHRDVKPENLVLEYDEHGGLIVKLVDFGISKSLDEPRNMTMEGMVLGTPHYMAPEQVEAGELDERTDVYAAGAVLYEAITGRTPFRGTTADEVMTAVQRDPVMPPGIYRDECPFELEAVVMTAMSRDKEARFRTAMLMREALLEAETLFHADSRPTPLVVPKKRDEAEEAPASAMRGDETTQRLRPLATSYASDDELDLRRPRGRSWLWAAAVVALVLSGMTAFAALTGDDRPARASRGPIASPITLAAAEDIEDTRTPSAASAGTATASPATVAESREADGALAGEDGTPLTADEAAATETGAALADDSTESAAEADADRRRARRRRARSAPVTTLFPASGDGHELAADVRERVRDSVVRDWPIPEDEVFEDPAKEDGDPALPTVVRTNPYEASNSAGDVAPESEESPPARPYGEIAPRTGPYGRSGARENLPANPF